MKNKYTDPKLAGVAHAMNLRLVAPQALLARGVPINKQNLQRAQQRLTSMPDHQTRLRNAMKVEAEIATRALLRRASPSKSRH